MNLLPHWNMEFRVTKLLGTWLLKFSWRSIKLSLIHFDVRVVLFVSTNLYLWDQNQQLEAPCGLAVHCPRPPTLGYGQDFCTCTVSGFHTATFQILPTLSFVDVCNISTYASRQTEAGEHRLREVLDRQAVLHVVRRNRVLRLVVGSMKIQDHLMQGL